MGLPFFEWKRTKIVDFWLGTSVRKTDCYVVPLIIPVTHTFKDSKMIRLMQIYIFS